jgi:uncharacterized protein (TIGR00269 family)
MNLLQKTQQTITKYRLCSKKEKILVALSGGKDSAAAAFILKKLGYNIEGLHIDLSVPDYSSKSLESAEKLSELLNIKLHIYSLKKEQKNEIKYFWNKNSSLSHCSVCGVFKKWILNKKARELNFKKIATGHNLDDEALTFLLNIIKGSPQLSANTGPVTRNIKNKKFITRIKPLFFIPESEILKFAEANSLPFIKSKCPFRDDSYRVQLEVYFKKLTLKQKSNLIKNLNLIQPKLQKLKSTEMNYCEICTEPSRGNICKKCRIIN